MITRSTKRIGTVTLIALMVSIGVVWWLYQQINVSAAELYDKQVMVAQAQAYKETLSEAEQAVASAQAGVTAVRPLVLTESDTITFLTDLESYGRSQGVDVVTDAITSNTEADTPHIGIRLQLTGTEANAAQMLEYLEALPYASWLRNIEWQTVVGETGVVEIRVELYVVLRSI